MSLSTMSESGREYGNKIELIFYIILVQSFCFLFSPMIRSLLIALSSVLLLSSCGGTSTPAREVSPSAHTSTTHLVMTAHTPTPGDSGDFFIR